MARRLFRNTSNKVLGGVCSGLGEHLDVDPVIIRAAFVILALGWGFSIFVYIVLWIIVPPREFEAKNEVFTEEGDSDFSEKKLDKSEKNNSKAVFGVILIAIGLLWTLGNIWYWFNFEYIWPLILIGIGAWLLFSDFKFKKREEEA